MSDEIEKKQYRKKFTNNGVRPWRGGLKDFWKDKSKFGTGTHGMLLNAQVFDPGFLDGRFTWNELGFHATLTFICWKYRDWEILATESFIAEGLAKRGIDSSGSIKRFKTKWSDAGFLKRVHYGGLSGNRYLVAPLLLIESEAEIMGNYDAAHALLLSGFKKARQEKAAAEAHAQQLSKERTAEKKRQEQEWLAAARRAKAAGHPAPDPSLFITA